MKIKEIDEKVSKIEDILKNKIDLENKIKEYDDKIDSLEHIIKSMEDTIMKQNETIKEITESEKNNVKHLLRKKNILERIEEIEKTNAEKDLIIKSLTEKVKNLEEKSEETNEKEYDKFQCEYCEFSARNQRGLQLHVKAKHDVKKVELVVLCEATDDYLSIDRDAYKKELETEIDVLEDVTDMFIDASNIPKSEIVGKLLKTKIVIRSRIPAAWESESFRKDIWQRINSRIPKGKICEKMEES